MKKHLCLVAAFGSLAVLTASFQNCSGGKSRRLLEGTAQIVNFDSKISDQTVYIGDPVSFSVVLREEADGVRYQWFKDGSKLAGITGNIFHIESARIEDTGDYSVEILSDDFSPEIQNARLTVLEKPIDPVAPEFTKQPQSKVLQPGDRLVLDVAVTGHPQPGLQWYKNGQSLAHTAPQLIIDAVAGDDAGDYTVLAANKGGEALSVVAKITVQTDETFSIDNRTACKKGFCRVVSNYSATPDPVKVEALCKARNYPYLVDYSIRYGRYYEDHCNADGTACYRNYSSRNVVATSMTCTNNPNLRKLEVICVDGKKPNNGRCN